MKIVYLVICDSSFLPSWVQQCQMYWSESSILCQNSVITLNVNAGMIILSADKLLASDLKAEWLAQLCNDTVSVSSLCWCVLHSMIQPAVFGRKELIVKIKSAFKLLQITLSADTAVCVLTVKLEIVIWDNQKDSAEMNIYSLITAVLKGVSQCLKQSFRHSVADIHWNIECSCQKKLLLNIDLDADISKDTRMML